MKKIYLLFVLVCCLSSCSFQTFYPQTGSIVYEPVAAENVEIHLGDIDQEYIIIGVVAVDAMGQGDKTTELLKKKAGSLGADAVIKTELTKVGSGVIRTGMSGIAVKLK